MGSIADVVDRAATGELNQEFTILSIALGALPDLAAALAGPGPFTFFAPTDEAFLAAFPGENLGDLVANTAALERALLQHIVSGKILSTNLETGDNLVTKLDGSEYNVTKSGMDVMVANANVLEADLVLSNGVMHVIDAVIQLP